LSLKEVFLEGAVSSLLEVLSLDILQVTSLLGGVLETRLDSFSLSLDAIDDASSGGGDLIHHASRVFTLVSHELVIRAGFKVFTTESGVVHEDGLEVLKNILAGGTENGKGEGGVIETWKSEGLISTANVESSEKRVSPIIDLKNKSIEFLEVEDAEGADGTKDGSVTSHLFDFSLLEEESFDTLASASHIHD